MKSRKVIAGCVALLLLIGLVAAFEYNKPPRSAAAEKGIAIKADQLYRQFTENEKAADSLYRNKVLQVTGSILSIKHTNQGQDVLVLDSGDPVFGTSCTLEQPSPQLKALKPGDQIAIKGICTGYLTDVVLIRSTLVN
jgi:hypothetical protein